MKKGLTKILTLIILAATTMMMHMPKVQAATATFSVKSSKSTVVIGSTFDVTITISSSINIGAWKYTV